MIEQADAGERLDLDVTDFGPIVRANVELRPLTVFVGPSNTGKSYLAILIYALHRFFGGGSGFAGRRFAGVSPLSRLMGRQELSAEAVETARDVARTLLRNADSKQGRGRVVLPPGVTDAVRSAIDSTGVALAGEIGRCFGVAETHTLTRKGRRSAARVVLRQRGSPTPTEHVVTLGRSPELRMTVSEDLWIPVGYGADDAEPFLRGSILMLDDSGDDSLRRFAARDFLATIADWVTPAIVAPLHQPAYYLPADRTGVMHAHSVVVSALIASAPAGGLRPAARTPVLSGVLADFLEQLIEIDRPARRRRGSARDLAAQIEAGVLGGSVRFERSAAVDYPRFAYRPEGWQEDLPLANASSMVSELAPVVLYLRHIVEPGSVLIVEEPESHLHPAMQVAFTRQLVALVHAGIRVIVTTHSEWLLEELANVVRRSELPVAKRGGVEGGDLALGPEQVGAWLFEPRRRPRGSVVREIALDDTGLYSAGYDDVAAALHNDWADISSGIETGS